MSICDGPGRLGNQIVRSLAFSILAEKFDLFVNYEYKDIIDLLGLNLFVGNRKFENTYYLTDNNYYQIFNSCDVNYNLVSNGYFQTKKITDMIHAYINSEKQQNRIISNNKFKDRYKTNNDCFVHIRLGDVEKYNPGFEYYNKILSKLSCENIIISTNDEKHPIVIKLLKHYYNAKLYKGDNLIDIILFGSTCKNVILSYGTFSAIIGYLAYYSKVFCLQFSEKYAWDWNSNDECDMFRDKCTKICSWEVVDV